MKIINGIRRDGYMFSKHIIVQRSSWGGPVELVRDIVKACFAKR
jgi:hypothetical protein